MKKKIIKEPFSVAFTLAEAEGPDTIWDVYDRIIKKYKNNVLYLTELAIVLRRNWSFWFDRDEKYAQIYEDLWMELDDWCMDNLNKEDRADYLAMKIVYSKRASNALKQ